MRRWDYRGTEGKKLALKSHFWRKSMRVTVNVGLLGIVLVYLHFPRKVTDFSMLDSKFSIFFLFFCYQFTYW